MSDAVLASIDNCIKCTLCDQACPVASATQLFPGPRYAGPQSQRFRAGASVDRSVEHCSGCGACSLACPQGVAVAELNIRAKAEMRRGIIERVRNAMLGDTEAVGRLAGLFPRVANAALASPALRRAAQRAVGLHRKAPLPAH